MQIRNEREKIKALKKAQRDLRLAINRSTANLRALRVAARKENKEKKRRIDLYKTKGDILALEDLILSREPDKDLTPFEAARLTREGYFEYFYIII
jgi:hypothetical protein